MIVKRIFDLCLAGIGGLLFLPFGLLIAVAIRLDSRGPALFRQIRVGRNGAHFEILKFRTMCIGAERIGPSISAGRDARVTRIGRMLRKSKLDEVPQLLNVLKGEMSLVGPRPEVPEFVEMYPTALRELVLSVPPGITDLASLQFRNEGELLDSADDPRAEYVNRILPEKLKLYEKYIRNQSVSLDLKILYYTVAELLGVPRVRPTRESKSNGGRPGE